MAHVTLVGVCRSEVLPTHQSSLRADPQTLRFLRLRVADLETRLTDLTSNNRDVLDGFEELGRLQADKVAP